MNAKTQVEFVKQLSDNVVNELIADIEKGKTPDEWDGIELRQLLADRFAAANYVMMTRSRKRDYNNTVIINNL